MARTMVDLSRTSREIAPGVALSQLAPGGPAGPHGETLSDTPGGQVWSDVVALGEATDDFQLTLPDLRMPANQYWPMHWHDCWIAIVVLEGKCLVGDWWMQPGDVLIAEAGVEYGPLLVGPRGCRLFEIFAKQHLQAGGYAPEYRDHPTLEGTPMAFVERSARNRRNAGRQTLPLDGVEGLTQGRLAPGARWDLGAPAAPDRGLVLVTGLKGGERLRPHDYADWRAMVVLQGGLLAAGRMLGKDALLVIRPESRVPELQAGPDGALLLEVVRSAKGDARRFVNLP